MIVHTMAFVTPIVEMIISVMDPPDGIDPTTCRTISGHSTTELRPAPHGHENICLFFVLFLKPDEYRSQDLNHLVPLYPGCRLLVLPLHTGGSPNCG